MPDLFPVTVDDMLAELRREIEVRYRVYPRQVAQKLLSADAMDRRIAIFEALIAKLEGERRCGT